MSVSGQQSVDIARMGGLPMSDVVSVTSPREEPYAMLRNYLKFGNHKVDNSDLAIASDTGRLVSGANTNVMTTLGNMNLSAKNKTQSGYIISKDKYDVNKKGNIRTGRVPFKSLPSSRLSNSTLDIAVSNSYKTNQFKSSVTLNPELIKSSDDSPDSTRSPGSPSQSQLIYQSRVALTESYVKNPKDYLFKTVTDELDEVEDRNIIDVKNAVPDVKSFTSKLLELERVEEDFKKIVQAGLSDHKYAIIDKVTCDDEEFKQELNAVYQKNIHDFKVLRRYKYGTSPADKLEMLEYEFALRDQRSARRLHMQTKSEAVTTRSYASPKKSPARFGEERSISMVKTPVDLEKFQVLNPPPRSAQSANAGSQKGDPIYNPATYRTAIKMTKEDYDVELDKKIDRFTQEMANAEQTPIESFEEADDAASVDTSLLSECLPLPSAPVTAASVAVLSQSDEDSYLGIQSNTTTSNIENSLRLSIGTTDIAAVQSSSRSVLSPAKLPGDLEKTLACVKCTKSSCLWCPECAKPYCFNCWRTVAHHSMEDAIECLREEIPSPDGNSYARERDNSSAQRGNSGFKGIVCGSKSMPSLPPLGSSPTKSGAVKLVKQTPKKYRDYHKNPVFVDGTGFIHEVRPEDMTKALRGDDQAKADEMDDSVLRSRNGSRHGSPKAFLVKTSSPNHASRGQMSRSLSSTDPSSMSLKVAVNKIVKPTQFDFAAGEMDDEVDEMPTMAQRSAALAQRMRDIEMDAKSENMRWVKKRMHALRPIVNVFSLGSAVSQTVDNSHKPRRRMKQLKGIAKMMEIDDAHAKSGASEGFYDNPPDMKVINGKVVFTRNPDE